MCRQLIIFAIILFLPFSTFAADIRKLEDSNRIVNPIELIATLVVNLDRQERKDLAIEFSKLFKVLDKAIPSLTPSEQEWLINESSESAFDSKRFSSLKEKVEFQQKLIKEILESILGATNCIIEAQKIRKEIHCWSQISYYFVQGEILDNGLRILEKGNKIFISKEKIQDLYDKKPFDRSLYRLLGQGIIKYIITPYLAGELKN